MYGCSQDFLWSVFVFTVGVIGNQRAMPKKGQKKKEPPQANKKEKKFAVGQLDVSKATRNEAKSKPQQQEFPLSSPMKRARRVNSSAADRALKEKFWWLPSEYLDGLEVDGTTPADDVADELARLANSDSYISYNFWLELDAKWRFERAHAFDQVPPPAAAETVRKELSDALQVPKSSNPSSRTVGKLRKFFEYCDGVNYSELYGCLMGCKPHLNLSPTHSFEMHMALMELIIDYGYDQDYPEMWEASVDVFEKTFIRYWEQESSGGRSIFIQQNRMMVARFVPLDAVDEVEKALKAKQDPQMQPLQKCLQTLAGSALYKTQVLKFAWYVYCLNAAKAVQEIVYHNFEEAELKNMKCVMNRDVAMLKENTGFNFNEKDQVLPYMGLQAVKVEVEDPHDQWRNLLDGERKTICVSNNLVPRYPLEILMHGETEQMEGVSQTVKIPDEQVQPLRVFRQGVLEILQAECKNETIDSYERCLKKYMKQFQRQDKTWRLDWNALTKYASKAIASKIEAEALSAFPPMEASAKRDIGATCEVIENLKTRKEVLALPVTFSRQLNGATTFLMKLREGAASPQTQDFEFMSDFMKKIHEAASAFCFAVVDTKQTAKSPFFGKKISSGSWHCSGTTQRR